MKGGGQWVSCFDPLILEKERHSRWPLAVSFFCASASGDKVTQLRDFVLQLRWIHISLSLASRGDEVTDEESLVSVGFQG